YCVTLKMSNDCGCTCDDFKFRGGFCKHMRAALIMLNRVRACSNQPLFVTLDKNAAVSLWKSSLASLTSQMDLEELGLMGDEVENDNESEGGDDDEEEEEED
ncbi:hypothetical protein HDU76_003932, partial [Blyttiomyces sp. JEL0837]